VFENEWRANNLAGRSANGQSDCFSKFSYSRARVYAIRERRQDKNGDGLLGLLSDDLTYILVGMLAARKNPKRRIRVRDSERTRERLLQAASREIYRLGFQSASLDTILAVAGVTKGALYYHFDSKEALGYAVVDEVIAADVRDKWVHPLQNGKDPIDALIRAVQAIPVRPVDVRGGCQLNNLAQEMSPLDAGFRRRLATIFHAWREAVASVLREGQTHGRVRRDVEPADAAGLLIAMVEGYASLAKNAQDPKVMKAGIRNIVDWLQSLRAPGNRKRV
jgi:TetR/AcrR family transcriptional regulator, transcriptional repressor for nem operon